MLGQVIINSLKSFFPRKPFIAALTVFAYTNAFVMPIHSASAAGTEIDKYEEERKGRSVKLRQENKSLFAPIKEFLFSPDKEEDSSKVVEEIKLTSKYKRQLLCPLKKVTSQLKIIEDTPFLDDTIKPRAIPTLPDEPTDKEKYEFIRDVVGYAITHSEDAVQYFKDGVPYERAIQSKLRRLQIQTLDFKDELNKGGSPLRKAFNQVQREMINKAVDQVQTRIEKQIGYSEDEIAFLKSYQEEAQITLDRLKEHASRLNPEKPVKSAQYILQHVLGNMAGTLPDEVTSTIRKHGLDNTLPEDMVQSGNWFMRQVGKVLNVLTSDVGKTAVIFFAAANLPAVAALSGVPSLGQEAKLVSQGRLVKFLEGHKIDERYFHERSTHAQMTINSVSGQPANIDTPTFTFNENSDVNPMTPSLQTVNSVGGLFQQAQISISPACGNIACTATTPDVTCSYAPANPVISQSNNLINFQGVAIPGQINGTQLNTHLLALKKTFTQFSCPPLCKPTLFLTSGTFFDIGEWDIFCNQVFYPITVSSCSIPPVQIPGTVLVDATSCPYTDVNGGTPNQILTQILTTTNGFFNIKSNPLQPLNNYTRQQVLDNLIQFTATSTNQPTATTQLCFIYPNGTIIPESCSAPVVNKFTATTVPPQDNTLTIVSIAVPTVVGVLCTAATIWLVWFCVKRKGSISRKEFAPAQIIRSKMLLDFVDLTEGDGALFRTFVINMVNKLDADIRTPFGTWGDDEKEIFIEEHLVPAIEKAEGIRYKANPNKRIHRQGQMKLEVAQLEDDKKMESVSTETVNRAIATWSAKNANYLPVAHRKGTYADVPLQTYPPAYQPASNSHNNNNSGSSSALAANNVLHTGI